LNIEVGGKESETDTEEVKHPREKAVSVDEEGEMDETDKVSTEDDLEDGSPENLPGEVFDEDEKELFEKLMRKIQDAGDLDKELDSDFSDFTERVENVVDSVERIENIERSSMEDLVYKEGEAPPLEVDGSSTETQQIEGRGEPEALSAGVEEEIEKPADLQTTYETVTDQIQILPESPYIAVKEGEIKLDERGELPYSYGTVVESVISKMLKLITIKISKGETEKALELFNAARDIGGNTELFKVEYPDVARELGIDIRRSGVDGTNTMEGGEIPIEREKETKVLDPEMAEEISALEKKARSVLEQLDHLIRTSDLPREEYSNMKGEYVKAAQFFREKRFHRSFETASVALGDLKVHVQDDMDNKIQDTLYKAREMMEEFSRNAEDGEEDTLEKLKSTMDRAMKAYLTNEYEKAGLLAKRVMDRILEKTEPDGGPLYDKLNDMKKAIKELKEMNIPNQESEHIQDVLRSAETLLERRDTTNAERVLLTISDSITEAREKGKKYIAAKELEIKIANRIQRLKNTGHDIISARKKLDFLNSYLKEERYDDVLIIGQEIEFELESIERLKREMDSKEIFDRLEILIENVDDLDDPESMRGKFEKIREAYHEGDLKYVKTEGKNLAELLSRKTRTIGIDRAKRIASAIVENRLLFLKLTGMHMDTSDWERRARKARNLLKEGSHREGLSQLEQISAEMKEKQMQQVDFLKNYISIYRDSLEVLMDRHREEPVMYHLKRKQVPILRKMAEVGKYQNALESYRDIVKKLTYVRVPDEKREYVETELNEVKFEIYKRKEQGLDISEPLSLYTLAQKRWGKGDVVPAEYLVEVSRRYCDTFMPMT